MPRNQILPEELEPRQRGVIDGREHHEPDPDGRTGHAGPKRRDGDDEEPIGRPHVPDRDDDDDDPDEDDLDRVSFPRGSSGAGRAPDREAEADELDDADLVENLDLDDLDDDDLMRRDGPDEPDE